MSNLIQLGLYAVPTFSGVAVNAAILTAAATNPRLRTRPFLFLLSMSLSCTLSERQNPPHLGSGDRRSLILGGSTLR